MNLTEIKTTLALLFDPGQVVGVSGIRLNDTMSKKFYTDLDLAAAVIERADASRNFKGIYISLQMLKEDSTSDKRKDIASYVHLMIDFDRKTKNGNASDEERRTIEAVMQEAREWLSGILQSEPLVADTGNGFHLIFKLQPFTADERAMVLLKECILAVKTRFERPGLNLEIDASVAEPEQLTRC